MTEHASNRKWKDINTPLILTIGIVSAILVFGVIVPGIKALTYTVESRFMQRSLVAQPIQELRAHRLNELEMLHSYRWINQQQGIAAIPIDRAIELYAGQNRQPGPNAPESSQP